MTNKLTQKDINDLDSIIAFLTFLKSTIMQYLGDGTLYGEENNKFREKQKELLIKATEKVMVISEKL